MNEFVVVCIGVGSRFSDCSGGRWGVQLSRKIFRSNLTTIPDLVTIPEMLLGKISWLVSAAWTLHLYSMNGEMPGNRSEYLFRLFWQAIIAPLTLLYRSHSLYFWISKHSRAYEESFCAGWGICPTLYWHGSFWVGCASQNGFIVGGALGDWEATDPWSLSTWVSQAIAILCESTCLRLVLIKDACIKLEASMFAYLNDTISRA